jgi:hypothetical protein
MDSADQLVVANGERRCRLSDSSVNEILGAGSIGHKALNDEHDSTEHEKHLNFLAAARLRPHAQFQLFQPIFIADDE